MKRRLEGPRLLLRAPQPGDADFAHARWATDAAVLRHLGWRPHATLEQTRAQLGWDDARWLKRSAHTWMIVPKGENGPVGQVQLVPQQLQGPVHHFRLGCLLAKAWQGRGLMREALALVLAEAWAQASTRRVDAVCDVDNAASLRLLQAAGLVVEGRLAAYAVHPAMGDEPRDVWLLAAARRG